MQAQKALTFKLYPWDQEPDYACIKWTGEIDLRADQPLQPAAPKPTDEQQDTRTKIDKCIDTLGQMVDAPGDHWSNEVLVELHGLGFKDSTIDSARARGPFDAKRRKMPSGEMGWKIVRTDGDDTSAES